jgi:hypothetical protein
MQHEDKGTKGQAAREAIEGEAAPRFPVLRPRELWTPCTACDRLNAAGWCSHYGRIMPDPEKPNACPHYTPKLPDVPWK